MGKSHLTGLFRQWQVKTTDLQNCRCDHNQGLA